MNMTRKGFFALLVFFSLIAGAVRLVSCRPAASTPVTIVPEPEPEFDPQLFDRLKIDQA